MDYFYAFAAFVFGCTVGSFLNVVIFRLPRDGWSINRPRRSFCPHCGTTIRWYDNIPVLSRLALGGACRYCGVRISARYPLVELLSGAVFTLAAVEHGIGAGGSWPRAIVIALFGAAMIVVTFIDMDFRIIPDEISIPGMLLGIVFSALVPSLHAAEFGQLRYAIEYHGLPLEFLLGNETLSAVALSIAGLAAGGGIIIAIRAVASAIAGREAMGLGDVKLMAFAGAFLGWRGAVGAIILGALIGALIAPAIRIFGRSRDPKIAFGPFLAAAAFLLLLGKGRALVFINETYPGLAARHPDALMAATLGLCVLMIVYLVVLRSRKSKKKKK